MFLPSKFFKPPGRQDDKHKRAQHSNPHPRSSYPIAANFASNCITIACGVAIFHVASERVVLCYHARDRYWFLPKGRRDAGEETGRAAEREGFEESGYRNRLLPLPIRHNQPLPVAPLPGTEPSAFSTEPIWTQMVPQTPTTQYVLFWYIAETLPPDVEASLNPILTANHPIELPASEPTSPVRPHLVHANTWPSHPLPTSGDLDPEDTATRTEAGAARGVSSNAVPGASAPYMAPPPYPRSLSLLDRLAQEPHGYDPPRHENTGVNEEEAWYESALVPVTEAIEVLGKGVMADVVRVGWSAIKSRLRRERDEKGRGTTKLERVAELG